MHHVLMRCAGREEGKEEGREEPASERPGAGTPSRRQGDGEVTNQLVQLELEDKAPHPAADLRAGTTSNNDTARPASLAKTDRALTD